MTRSKKRTSASTEVGILPLRLYHRSREIRICRIAFIITLSILMIALGFLLYCFSVLGSLDSSLEAEKGFTQISTNEIPIYESFISDYPGQLAEPKTMPICSLTSTFKSYMDYRKITNTSTRQWRLQQTATTDEHGFRKVGDFYMVAMAKMYGPVGTKYLITFSGGQQMPVIIGDLKAGTDCLQKEDNSLIEIIVDSTIMPSNIKRSGNYNSMIVGTITQIEVASYEDDK